MSSVIETQTISLRGGRHALISRATEVDAGSVLAHYETAAAETDFLGFGPGQIGRSLEEEVARLRALRDPQHGLLLKAVVEGELAGIVSIHRFQTARLHHSAWLALSVLEKFWGLGLGRALGEAAIMAAGHIGITRIELRTRHDNTRALSLYEDLGFQLEGRLRGAIKVRGVEHDDLVMGLLLHAPGT